MLGGGLCYAYSSSVDSILRVLDNEISIADTKYCRQKDRRISDLRRSVASASDVHKKFDVYRSLYNEYLTYQYDSAYHYVREMESLALQTGDDLMRLRARAALITCFSRVGFFKEGTESLNDLNPSLMPLDEQIEFYFSAASLLQNMESFAGSDADLSVEYRKMRSVFYDSIIAIAGVNTYDYDLARLEKQRLDNFSDAKAFEMSKRLVRNYDLTDTQKAKIYSTIGRTYAAQNETDSAIYSFAKSAICDLRASVKETTSARNLAELMLECGDIERASRYINLASKDAKTYNSRIRPLEINPLMMAINAVHHHKMATQRLILIVLVLTFSVMFFIVFRLLLKLRGKNLSLTDKQKEILSKNTELELANENLVDMNVKLKETAEIKDQYIIESLLGMTNFANEVADKTHKALNKLNGKKYGEVASLLEDIGPHETFVRAYASFDSAFLRLFPNFIDELNRLLAPDARITINDGHLTNEIRIFALMRVGFSTTAEIAKYLGLSVNTVYVYKAKIKSKAIIDKAEFEARIMSIPKP